MNSQSGSRAGLLKKAASGGVGHGFNSQSWELRPHWEGSLSSAAEGKGSSQTPQHQLSITDSLSEGASSHIIFYVLRKLTITVSLRTDRCETSKQVKEKLTRQEGSKNMLKISLKQPLKHT